MTGYSFTLRGVQKGLKTESKPDQRGLPLRYNKAFKKTLKCPTKVISYGLSLFYGVLILTLDLSLVSPPAMAHDGYLVHREQVMSRQSLHDSAPRKIASKMISEYDWDFEQFICLEKLWEKESNWNPKADNPHSSAYGIAQLLKETATDPMSQIRNGMRYISHRYETPCNAWAFWLKQKEKRGTGWY